MPVFRALPGDPLPCVCGLANNTSRKSVLPCRARTIQLDLKDRVPLGPLWQRGDRHFVNRDLQFVRVALHLSYWGFPRHLKLK